MSLRIKWQRVTSHGETCERCRSTEEEIEAAVEKLETSLSALGMKVTLQKEKLSKEKFKNNPQESNRIFINGDPLEEWVNAETDQSECCEVCGENECRTVIVNGREYETIPSDLIVDAALQAVITMRGSSKACCSSETNSCCEK